MPRTIGAAQDPNGFADYMDPNAILLPEGFSLVGADFVQAGSDLLVTGGDGGNVLLRGFFAVDSSPDLVSAGGVRMAGSLVARLADDEAPVELAEALLGAGVAPVGEVASLNGGLSVIRADGSHARLEAGDAVYPGDILETDPGSTAAIALGDEVVFSLRGSGRVILRPNVGDSGQTPESIKLAAAHGQYAFACGAASQPMVIETPVGQIDADGAELVFTYLEDGGLQVILLPGADGSVGGLLVGNGAGVLQMNLPYEFILIRDADSAPDFQGVLNSDAIIAGYGRVLGGLPDTCDASPLVSAARMAAVETADLAGDSGDLSQDDLEALAEFETAAGVETTLDGAFTDARVVVTQQDPLASGSSDPASGPQLSPTSWAPLATHDGGLVGGGGRSEDGRILSELDALGGPTFPKPPPDARPPVQENFTVTDWDPGLRQWKVLVPQEPEEYEQDVFYRQVDQYDEPERFVFRPLVPEQIAGQFLPTSGPNLVLMSAGPLTGAQETGRGAEVEHIEGLFFGVPIGTFPDDIDGSSPADGAAMKTTIAVNPGDVISFDWMFDARDQVSSVGVGGADDYAVFVADGEWYRLSGVRDTGSFGASGWRTSEWTYTGASRDTVTIGFAVLNDFRDSNEPRLLIDSVRLNQPISSDLEETGGAQVKGVGALQTFVLPPTANDDPNVTSTTENRDVAIDVTDLLANDSDPNALQTLSITLLDVSGTAGTVVFSNAETISYSPNGQFEVLVAGDTVIDSFRYEITNLSGGRDTATVTLTIEGENDAPTSANVAISAEEDGLSVTGAFVGADIDSDDSRETLTYAITRSPSEGSVAVNGGGGFTFDPGSDFQDLGAGQTRNITFDYNATDRHGATSRQSEVTVSVTGANDAPTSADVDLSAMEDGPLVTIDFAADDIDSDNDRATLTYILTRLPSEGSVAINGDGSFTFDPGSDFQDLSVNGTRDVTFTYNATDIHGEMSGEALVTVTVAGINDTPVAGAVVRTTDEDAGIFSVNLLDGTITADVDVNDVLKISIDPQYDGAGGRDLDVDTTSLPGVLSFDPRGVGDLAVGEVANLVFEYTVDDQRGQSNSTATNTVTVTVEGRNDAPTADNDAYPTFEDSPLTVTADGGLLIGDVDPDASDSLRVSGVNGQFGNVGSQITLPSGAVVTVKGDGSFSYDQAGGFDGLKDGEATTDSFVYTVSDNNGATAPGQVTISIVGVNDGPQANDDSVTASEDAILSVPTPDSVLVNDSDPEGEALSVTPFNGTSALGAIVAMAADGSYTYDPTALEAAQALGAGETLADSFIYEVNDGSGGVDRATVTVTVEGANDAPEANEVSFRTFKGSPLQVDVVRGILANDADPDTGDVLAVAAVNGEATGVGQPVALASGALVTVNADGTFSYDPNGQFEGLGEREAAADSFAYTVSDGAGVTDTATVTVTITGFKEQAVGSFELDANVWGSVGDFTTHVAYTEPDGVESRFGATDGPRFAVLEAAGSSASGIETSLALPTGVLPRDSDLSRPNTGAAIGTEIFVKSGDQIHFDWNFDANDAVTTTGYNDFAVFTVSDGATSLVFTLSDVRQAGDFGGTGWQGFSYDPTADFDVDTDGETLTIGFAVLNDQNDQNPSHLLVDNVRMTWRLPAPVNDVITVAADTPLPADPVRSLLVNDRDAAGTGMLSVFAVNPTSVDDGTSNVGAPITLASGALLTVNADGTFALDPSGAAQLQSLALGESLVDGFSYAITDGNDRSSLGSASVKVTFTGVNDVPVAGDDTAFTDEHSAVRISTERLLANDSDPDGSDGLTITAVDVSGSAGTVTLGDDGFITFDPNGQFSDLAAGEEATDTFRYTVEDGHGGSNTATVTVRVLGQADPPASLGQIITSFEEIPLGGWHLDWDRIKPSSSEPVSIVTEYNESDGAGGQFAPTNGRQMVSLEAFGSSEDPVTSIADFLGVRALPSDSDGTRSADGSAMRTTITVKAGDEISFDWMFDASDQSVGGTEVFNDYAAFTVSGPNGSEVFKLADVRQTGDFGASGWRTSKYVAATDGELTIGFTVMNDAVSHGAGSPRNSHLLVDNVRLNREFSDGYQLLDGRLGDNFQTWAQVPVAGDDVVATTEDSPLTIAAGDLLANDFPPNVGGALGVTGADSTGTFGVVTRNVDGSINYDPRGKFEALGAGETATDVFHYTVSGENGGTATAEVVVTIQGLNDAPVAQSDVVATTEDTPMVGNVIADNGQGEDTDADGDNLTVSRVNGAAANVGSQIALASGALLLMNADGTFTYDPNGRFEFLAPGETATDTFTYTVDDAIGGTATATVSVTVAGVNDAPVANDDTSSTNEDTVINIDLIGNDTDPEASTLTVAGLNDSATMGLLRPNGDGTVTYDPSNRFDFLAEGERATDTFSYSINDGMGGSDSATVNVDVMGVNDAPAAENDAASTDEDAPVVVAVLGNDVDAEGAPLTVTGLDDSGTLGLIALNGDGTVTYDPNAQFESLGEGETATDTFSYTVEDGNGGIDVATVTVTVNGVGNGQTETGDLVESFEGVINSANRRGQVSAVFQYTEPDGAHGQFSPTDGNSMAMMTASGASPLSMEFFLGLSNSLPADFGDSSLPADGSALRLTIDVEEGDRISFDWMFDANDSIQPPLGDFARPGFNDFAVFTADGNWFKLSDVRQTFDESGTQGATGWRTSIYTARSDGPLTIGFAAVNDDNRFADSHLLVDNIRINRDFDSDSYTVVQSDTIGGFDTVIHNQQV